jgi:AcrR family transcriptional regulator
MTEPAPDALGPSGVPAKRRQGRPRSRTSQEAIQRATLELLSEKGLAMLTIEAVAARAGASKATIYRWWPNKATLAMEAFVGQIVPALPFEDTGDLHGDFRRHLGIMVDVLHTQLGRTLADIIAGMQHDEELAEAFSQRYLVPRRKVPRQALQNAIKRGELQADADPDVIMDAIYGAIYFSLLIRKQRIDATFVETLLLQVLGAPPD